MQQGIVLAIMRDDDPLLPCRREEVFGVVRAFHPRLSHAYDGMTALAEQSRQRGTDIVIEIESGHYANAASFTAIRSSIRRLYRR